MISDSQQEEAALYALGLLDADEAAVFENQLDADPEQHALVRDLQESAALLALAGEGTTLATPSALRQRVLSEVKARPTGVPGAAASRTAWLPWAIAALCMGCAGALWWSNGQQQTQLAATLRRNVDVADAMLNPAQLSLCALEPTPEFNAQPRAAVLWDAVHRRGKLRVNRLAPPADGKDYQLWTVEAGRKEPVSAGLVHVDADGTANVLFLSADSGDKPVVAVAISLEKAGGSPTNQGPILLLGKF